MVPTLLLMATLAAGKAADCENLKSLKLSNGTITTAEFVPAGSPVAGARGGRGQGAAPNAGQRGAQPGATAATGQRGAGRGTAPLSPLPSHCRVTAVLKPSADSNIN